MAIGDETASTPAITGGGKGGWKADNDIDHIIKRFRTQRVLFLALRLGLVIAAVVLCVLSLFERIDGLIGVIAAVFCLWMSFSVPRSPKADLSFIDIRLFEDCDPYTYTQAYFRFLDLQKTPANRDICYLNISLGLFLQGEFKTMLSYLTSIDTRIAEPYTLYSYYDLWSRYYFLVEKDAKRLETVRGHLETIARNYDVAKLSELCRAGINRIDLFEAILCADAEAGRRLLSLCAPRTSKGRPSATFSCVEHNFFAAKLAEACGEWSRMQSDCIAVIEQGNLVFYVREASRMLESIPSAQTHL